MKKEVLMNSRAKDSGGLACNHDLEWAGQSGARGDDDHYYQYNAWNCKT